MVFSMSPTFSSAIYNNITQLVGCGLSANKLECLRGVPFEDLNNAINTTAGTYRPVVDGDFITDYSSLLLARGNFTKVPFLLGTNADEGTLFTSPSGSSDAQVAATIQASGPDANTTTILLELYPNIDAIGLPAGYQTAANSTTGPQYKRGVALTTDQLFLSWRRIRTNAWSKFGIPSYSYLFESPNTHCTYKLIPVID